MHRLPPRRTQMHFDSPFRIIPACFVLETAQIEIRAQFPVDPRQQIHIECRCYARRVVVSEQLQLDALLQVCAEQQRIAGTQKRPHLAQKLFARLAIEVADRTPKEQHQQVVLLLASFSHGAQPFQIRLLVADNAYEIDLSQFFFARRQRIRRNFDRVVIYLLPSRERFQDPARLLSRAAPEFRHLNRRRQPSHNLSRIFLQQPRVRPRQAILRQDANGFEQRRAHFVVQIFRRKFSLSGLGQARAHVRGEIRHVPQGK